MQPIYLLCGVSGSGKTWIAKQLTEKFHYIPHDEHYEDFEVTIHREAVTARKPLISECPFGERLVKEALEKRGVRVIPYFVIEAPALVAKRYMLREKKPIQKAALSRAGTIINRAKEWNAPYGTSAEVLEKLKNL